jgi:diamine N-acetyltransferase
MPDFRGGCLCGAVRFRLADYTDAGYCHCQRCRKFSGAPVTAWALAPRDAFELVEGAPAEYETRRFCATCGSSLYRVAGDRVFVHVGSLDDPNAVAPRVHQCIDSQLATLQLHDLLPWIEGPELDAEADRRYLRGPAEPTVTRDSAVSLREVSANNLRAVLRSDVAGNQRRFVAPNSVSVAQGLVQGDAWIRAIYADETVVGFAMAEVIKQDELGLTFKGDPYVWRFMIDSRYQGLGFGGRSLELMLADLRSWDGTRNIWISCVRGAGSPYGLYTKFGFVDTGVMDDDEIILKLPVE